MKPTLFIAILIILCFPGLSQAQENNEVNNQVNSKEISDSIGQLRITVFKLQQEILEMQESLDRQNKELRAQKEELQLQVEHLNAENKRYRNRLLEMDSLIYQMQDRLESSSLAKLSKELENLRNFNQALILDTINHGDLAEKLLLDIINQPQTSLPKDLLILILAQQKRRQGQYEDSIRYYSTLLAEFFGSIYFSQAIYEMSEVLGVMNRDSEQITLLAQLSSLSNDDPYSIKATEKLKELGAGVLFSEDTTSDTSSDSSSESPRTVMNPLAGISDTTADNFLLNVLNSDTTGDSEPAILPIIDSTADSRQPVPEKTDSTADTIQPVDQVLDSTADSGQPVPEKTDSTADTIQPVDQVLDSTADSEQPVPEKTDSTAETFQPVKQLLDSTTDTPQPEFPKRDSTSDSLPANPVQP